MKSKKKIVALLLCAVALVVGSVMGTMAWLTSHDEVNNTFTVGNVKITMDELDVDNDDNKDDITENSNPARDKANAYKLIPGHTYVKDPTVHVDSSSEECYVYVKLANGLKPIIGGTTIEAQMAAKGWVCIDEGEQLYVYQYAVSGTSTQKDLVVFDNFTINSNVDNTTLAQYKDATITVTAYAVQVDGFQDAEKTFEQNAAAAWDAAF